MEEFDEKQIQQLIEEALLDSSSQPMRLQLGLGETDLLEIIFNRLSKKIIESELADLFVDIRKDIVSRKISLNLRELHSVTKNCKKCNVDSTAELPKWNTNNPDVLVIVESPNMTTESVNLMVNSFKNIGFSSQNLCLTYVNRCPVKRKYENNEVINCSSYLHSEIQLINPKLIVCLGGLPASILFGTDLKLKNIHGQIQWLGYWPILATYSPMYVLKSNSLDQGSNSVNEQFDNDIFQAYNFVYKKKATDSYVS